MPIVPIILNPQLVCNVTAFSNQWAMSRWTHHRRTPETVRDRPGPLRHSDQGKHHCSFVWGWTQNKTKTRKHRKISVQCRRSLRQRRQQGWEPVFHSLNFYLVSPLCGVWVCVREDRRWKFYWINLVLPLETLINLSWSFKKLMMKDSVEFYNSIQKTNDQLCTGTGNSSLKDTEIWNVDNTLWCTLNTDEPRIPQEPREGMLNQPAKKRNIFLEGDTYVLGLTRRFRNGK